MKRTLTVTAPFDPVTQEEMVQILALQRSGKYDAVYLVPEEDGYLDKKIRTALLKKAVKPWRKLHVSERPVSGQSVQIDTASEKTVREGRYILAADGIRRQLAETGILLEPTVDAMCNAHRAAHSRSVAEVCRMLAESHGMDGDQAWRAGMMHDLTKGMSDEYNRRIIAVYAPEMLGQSPKIWHSYTAPVWLYRYMGLRDRKILQAIEHHTLGDGTGDLDRILYIADKTEPLRGYDASYELETAKKDLKEGADLVLAESRQYLREKEGIHV